MAEILLVGSPDGVLGRLPASLAGSEPDWSVRQIASGDAALEQLERRPAALVVASFAKEKGADPYEALFSAVAARSPASIRLALIGQQESLPGRIAFAHQTLAARQNLEYLTPIFRGAIEVARNITEHPQVQRIICNLAAVPSPPTLYFDIREQIEDPNGDLARMAEITARDPSLVASILKIANSGFYALPRTVGDLRDAIGLIGTDALLGLVLTAHLYAGLPPPGLRLELLREHTFMVSNLARQISLAEGGSRLEQSCSAVAGLLHDIGLMVLLENEPARYQPIWNRCRNDECALATSERAEFGVTHGELGALILSLWSLPDEVVNAVANSHAPAQVYRPVTGDLSLVSQSVAAATWLLDIGSEEAETEPDLFHGLPEATLGRWRGIRNELYGEAIPA